MLRPCAPLGLLALTLACGEPAAPPLVPEPPPPPGATCTIVLGASPFTPRLEARGEGATHTEACRAAALSAPADRRHDVEEVDGVSPLWIVAPGAEASPTAPGATPSTCELEVATDDGPIAEGDAEAGTEDAARAAAVAQACAALGAERCAPPSYLDTVTRREVSVSLHDGVSTTTHRVWARLRRVRRRAASASSDAGRRDACREAYRAACEGPCPDGTTLVTLDGVPLL